MKFSTRLLVVLAIVSATSTARAEKVRWAASLSEAREAMKQQDRPLLLFVTRKQCKFCTKMKDQTYTDHNIARQINASFVAVAVDAQSIPRLVKSQHIRAFPTTLLISPDARVVARIRGYVSPHDMQQRLSRAIRRPNARDADFTASK